MTVLSATFYERVSPLSTSPSCIDPAATLKNICVCAFFVIRYVVSWQKLKYTGGFSIDNYAGAEAGTRGSAVPPRGVVDVKWKGMLDKLFRSSDKVAPATYWVLHGQVVTMNTLYSVKMLQACARSYLARRLKKELVRTRGRGNGKSEQNRQKRRLRSRLYETIKRNNPLEKTGVRRKEMGRVNSMEQTQVDESS